MNETRCRTCHAELRFDANNCPMCGTPVRPAGGELSQTVPVPAAPTSTGAEGSNGFPWGATAVLGCGVLAVVVALVLARRPPAVGEVEQRPAVSAPESAPAPPKVQPPVASGPPVVLRMVAPPPSVPQRPPTGATAGFPAGAALPEPPFARTVTCSRAVKLKVDPDETEVEVNGTAVGQVESLHHGRVTFAGPGVYQLRLSYGPREAWVKVVVEAGAEETATVRLDLD